MENQSKMVGVRSGGEERGERRGWCLWEETQPWSGAERSPGSAGGPGMSCRAEPRDTVAAGEAAALPCLLSLPSAGRAGAEGRRLSSGSGPGVSAWGGWAPAHAPQHSSTSAPSWAWALT